MYVFLHVRASRCLFRALLRRATAERHCECAPAACSRVPSLRGSLLTALRRNTVRPGPSALSPPQAYSFPVPQAQRISHNTLQRWRRRTPRKNERHPARICLLRRLLGSLLGGCLLGSGGLLGRHYQSGRLLRRCEVEGGGLACPNRPPLCTSRFVLWNFCNFLRARIVVG